MSRPKLTHMPHQIEAREAFARAEREARRASHARLASTQGERPCFVCGEPGPFGFGHFRDRPGSLFACADPDHRRLVEQTVTSRQGAFL